MTARRPDFVLIGAQKAATTLLLHSLRAHPDAWLPPHEEPFFRDPVYDPDGLDAFAAPYADRTERRLGLKCPDYLARPEVPRRLVGALGEPDLVVCLRNPVARAVSAYFWHVRWGMLPLLPVEDGLRRILDGGLRDEDPTAGEILTWGLYGEHLARWTEVAGEDKLLVLVDTDLRRAPDDTMNRVHRFLGLEERGAQRVGRRRANEGVYDLTRLRFLQRRARVVLHWNDDRTFASLPRPRLLHQLVQNYAVAGIDAVVLSRVLGNARPTLSPGLQAALEDYYRADVQRLQAMLGRDLGWLDDADRTAARDA